MRLIPCMTNLVNFRFDDIHGDVGNLAPEFSLNDLFIDLDLLNVFVVQKTWGESSSTHISETYRNRWRRYTCDDMAEEPATEGNNGKRRRAALTVGRLVVSRRSRATAHCCLRKPRAQLRTMNRRRVIPSMTLRLHSLPQPCKVAETKNVNHRQL